MKTARHVSSDQVFWPGCTRLKRQVVSQQLQSEPCLRQDEKWCWVVQWQGVAFSTHWRLRWLIFLCLMMTYNDNWMGIWFFLRWSVVVCFIAPVFLMSFQRATRLLQNSQGNHLLGQWSLKVGMEAEKPEWQFTLESNRFLASIPAEVDQPVRLHCKPLGSSTNFKVRMYSWLETLCLEGIKMIVKVLPSICAVSALSGVLLYLEAWC